ncbi:6-phosphogluconolactonase, partial [Candidatus Gottesmanbacteria bacterium]|nr:6-phosphogluconolactonase [Candidatus Gottesmanbacteria bacterium]
WRVCRERNIPYDIISQEETLEKSGDQYDRTVEKLFKEYVYKVAVLGIGEDGHTAGLLPGYEKKWNKNKYIVGYRISQHRQNNAMALFCQGKGNFPQRISLTPKALKELDQAIIVAVGEKKKTAIKKLLNQSNESNLSNIDKMPSVIVTSIPQVNLR